MDIWLYTGAPMLAFCIVMYLLYCKGFVMTKCIAALIFVFRPGRDADRATLSSCTGWIRHVGRFQESGTYEFVFEDQLSKGNAEAVLLDKKKQPLLKLDRQSPTGKIELDTKNRYYLRWNFKGATGKCGLHWSQGGNGR